MRKTFAALALIFAVLTAGQATAGNTHNLVAVTTTATGASVPTGGACAQATVWSASTSTASVLFEQSADGTIWTTAATFTDPSSTATSSAFYYAKFSRLRVDTRSAGTLSGDIFWGPCTLFPTSITSFNNITFTKPATAATFTLAAGKTLTVAKTLGFTGTDGTTHTFPATSSSTARIDAAQTFTGVQTFSSTIAASAGVKNAVVTGSADGAITISPSSIYATKAGVLALTIATPTVTTHDGIRITVVATTSNANTITAPTNKIKMGGEVGSVLTFDGAVATSVTLEAFQGIWYVVGSTGVVTLL